MKNTLLAIAAFILFTGCGGRTPSELTDLGTATFTATGHGSESYQEVRPRRHTVVTVTKKRYYVMMETADGNWRYHKPAASLQRALEQTPPRLREPVPVEHQVFEDPATGDIYFVDKGLTEEQAIYDIKVGRCHRQESDPE